MKISSSEFCSSFHHFVCLLVCLQANVSVHILNSRLSSLWVLFDSHKKNDASVCSDACSSGWS